MLASTFIVGTVIKISGKLMTDIHGSNFDVSATKIRDRITR